MLGIFASFLIIIIYDLKTTILTTNNRAKTMVVYFMLMAVSLTVSVFMESGRPLLSPAVIIEDIMKNLGVVK